MRKIKVCLAAAIFILFGARACAADATVPYVRGKVEVQRDGKWIALNKGDTLCQPFLMNFFYGTGDGFVRTGMVDTPHKDITEHSVMRISGVGMDNLLKGNFSVDNDNCKVFLAPEGKAYIRLTTTDGQVYYVSGATAEETKAAYAALGR